MANTPDPWNSAKCEQLTASEADKLFFPTNGGKPGAAARYCSSCPILSLCLETAVAEGRIGFWAGTTDDERRKMSKFIATSLHNSILDIDAGKRRIFRKIITPEDHHAWLDDDNVEPSLPELVEIEIAS